MMQAFALVGGNAAPSADALRSRFWVTQASQQTGAGQWLVDHALQYFAIEVLWGSGFVSDIAGSLGQPALAWRGSLARGLGFAETVHLLGQVAVYKIYFSCLYPALSAHHTKSPLEGRQEAQCEHSVG